MSEIRFIIYRSDLNNLQARKKAERIPIRWIALSINGPTKRPQTQILPQFRQMS